MISSREICSQTITNLIILDQDPLIVFLMNVSVPAWNFNLFLSFFGKIKPLICKICSTYYNCCCYNRCSNIMNFFGIAFKLSISSGGYLKPPNIPFEDSRIAQQQTLRVNPLCGRTKKKQYFLISFVGKTGILQASNTSESQLDGLQILNSKNCYINIRFFLEISPYFLEVST